MSKPKNLIGVVLFCLLGMLLISAMREYCSLRPQPCVVKLKVSGIHNQYWQGTGFFIADDLILTAGHMVEGANDVWVIWSDSKKHKAVSWYQEPETDLGFIYIRTLEKEKTAKFGNAKVGEEVWVLGNPFGVYPVLSRGIISAINMPDDFMGQKNMIITDCAINAGNSGCPLFNKTNEILGVCSWGYNYAQGMTYFVRAKICELSLAKYYAIEALKEAE